MSRAAALGAVEFATESAFAESSSTFGSRLAVLGDGIDMSGLTHAKIDAARTIQYLNDGTMPVLGPQGGTFTTDFWLAGHGTTSAGAITLSNHILMLGYVLGSSSDPGDGGTATGGTATVITTTAASGLTPGQIFHLGSLGDGRGEGQMGVVSTHSSNNLTSLIALPAAPNNLDVYYSTAMVNFVEASADATVQSMRFRGLSANQQYAMHGCIPQSINLTGFNPGELPRASITWGVSRWAPVAATFPSAGSVDAFNPAPTAAGSLFFQARGTATRQVYSYRNFELTIQLGVTPLPGPGGVGAYQTVIGAQRTPAVITASFTVDAQTASATPTWHDRAESDSQFYHLGLNCNTSNGKRVSLYMPNVCMTDKPVQFMEGGINRERITVRAYTGTVTTSALTQSALRIGLG